MSLADNIRLMREEKGLMQKEVASEIGLKPAHYNKIEKGLVEPSIDTLDKIAAFYATSIDDIVHYKKGAPQVVSMEDKTAAEQLRLISQLNEKDKGIIVAIIDTMLTKQKFQDFFQQNIAIAK
jgi:transcriptional regulator with XRE-family HTH domain